MAQPSDFLLFRSENVATSAPRQNGGYLGNAKCLSGVKNAIFEDATDEDRLYGSVVYRKLFWKTLLPVKSVMLHMITPSSGDDSILMFRGTPSNLESDLTGLERKYGIGYLATNLNSGQTSLNVDIENADDNLFISGDTIYITDGIREEFQENVIVSKLSTSVLIILSNGAINNYQFKNTCVSSVVKVGDIEASYTTPVIVSANGSWNNALELDLNGTIDERWTIRFMSNSAFLCTGARLGTVGYGSLESEFAPTHIVDSVPKPYFILPAHSLQGSWQIGETFVFSTVSPTVSIWFRRTLKSGCLAGPSIFSHRLTAIDPAVL